MFDYAHYQETGFQKSHTAILPIWQDRLLDVSGPAYNAVAADLSKALSRLARTFKIVGIAYGAVNIWYAVWIIQTTTGM